MCEFIKTRLDLSSVEKTAHPYKIVIQTERILSLYEQEQHIGENWRNTNTQTISNHLVFPMVPNRRIQTAAVWWSIVSASGCWSERGFPSQSEELVRPVRCCRPVRDPFVAELHCCRTPEGELAETRSWGTLRTSGPSGSCTTHWTASLPWSSLMTKETF